MFLQQTRPVYNYQISVQHISVAAGEQHGLDRVVCLSASLLRGGPMMYPAALRWLSIAADVTGTQVTEQLRPMSDTQQS